MENSLPTQWADPQRAQELLNSIHEGTTLLHGRMPAAKRAMIERSIASAMAKLAALPLATAVPA